MKVFYFATGLFIAVLLFAGCSLGLSPKEAREKTEKLFHRELKRENVHNAFLHVYSPSLEIEWNFVGGKFQNGEAVSAANPFYTASIGKTFTATAIAILVEDGKIRFEDVINIYLPDSIMKDLHVFEGIDYSDEITIAQLLQHTSGIPDYIDDKTLDGTPNGMTLLFSDTAKFWHPMEMINLAKNKMKADFAPGTGYKYCNTDFVLLGLIIENVSGMQVHDFYRKYIFEPYEMTHTSMLLRSKPSELTGRMAEIYAGNSEVSNYTSLSIGWTGGGLVTTASDLNKFQVALHTNKIIKAETLNKMLQWIPESTGMYYGYGLRKVVFNERLPNFSDIQVVGHTGSTSSFMFYCPELDVYLAGTLNQTDEVKNSEVLMVKTLSVISQILNPGKLIR